MTTVCAFRYREERGGRRGCGEGGEKRAMKTEEGLLEEEVLKVVEVHVNVNLIRT